MDALMEALLEPDDSGKLHVSFHKLCPMPEILRHLQMVVSEEGRNLQWVEFQGKGRDMRALSRDLTEEERAEYDALGVTGGWYEWACENWGVKWNSHTASVDRYSETGLALVFDTAWGPPEPIFDLLHERFPGIHAEADYVVEGGMGSGQLFPPEPAGATDSPSPS